VCTHVEGQSDVFGSIIFLLTLPFLSPHPPPSSTGTKTRSGETEKSTNANARSFKPKMWATPDTPTRCPVRLYRAFIQRRPPEMCAADSPFYLAVNHHRKPTSFWYKKQPLGVTLLNRIMKELADKGGIQGKKTNHSARKTMIQTLCSANVPDSTIMQLSGHKSITSLNHYKKPSLDQQRSMSNLLSTLQADPSPSSSLSVSKQEKFTVKPTLQHPRSLE